MIKNILIFSLIVTFLVYVYYSENRPTDVTRSMDAKILIKNQKTTIAKLNNIIENLEKQNRVLETVNQELNKTKDERVLIDCSKPLLIDPKRYKETQPLDSSNIPFFGELTDTIQLDNNSKLKIKPFISPEKLIDGGEITIEKNF